jgi:DHA3 family macrolide efflux protein-like MFS transporter
MIALATLTLGAVLCLGYDALWLMFVAAAIRAAGAAVQVPAVGAFLPQFVPTEQLTRINGINGTIQAVIGLTAPIASGALMSLSPLFVLFFVDVGTAALAIGVLLAFVCVPTHAKAATTAASGYFEDLRSGLTYVHKSPFLMALFTYLTAMLVFLAPVAFLSPLQVARSYGPEVWRLTVIEVAFSGGMIVGGIMSRRCRASATASIPSSARTLSLP